MSLRDTNNEYLIVNRISRDKGHRYVTFWRHGNGGYCWCIEWAGIYSEETILTYWNYYNMHRGAGRNLEERFAVPLTEVKKLLTTAAPHIIDGDGPYHIVLQNKENLKFLRKVKLKKEEITNGYE